MENNDDHNAESKSSKGLKRKRKHQTSEPCDAIRDTIGEVSSIENQNHSETTENKKKKKKKKNKKAKVALSGEENTTVDSGSPIKQEKSNKKKKVDHPNASASSIPTSDDSEEKDNYPYKVVPDDHCETPVEAYEDIAPLLHLIAKSLGKTAETLSIYDPYFCEGKVKQRLGSLGFPNVYNEKEDFYQNMAANNLPNYDVLLTNPPYSLDHMNRLLHYCIHETKQPFCLLLPNYVYRKDYYINQYESFPMMFLAPSNGRRYLYTTPKGRRQQKSSKITSPFPTFWYCGRISHSIINSLKQRKTDPKSSIAIVQRLQDIPLEVAPDNDPRKKKLRNNLKRKKNKQRQKVGKEN